MKKISLMIITILALVMLTGCFNKIEVIDLSVKAPTKLVYVEGETFDSTGMVVTAFKNNGEQIVLKENEYSIGNKDLSKLGEHIIKVTYKKIEKTFMVYVNKEKEATVLVLENYPDKLFYETTPTKAEIALEGLDLRIYFNDGSDEEVKLEDVEIEVRVLTGIIENGYQKVLVTLLHETHSSRTGFYIFVPTT